VTDFLAAVRNGEDISVVAKACGKDVHFWLRKDLSDELADMCKKVDRRKNVVFLTALGRWIEREGKLH
jgi:hypothetical protein